MATGTDPLVLRRPEVTFHHPMSYPYYVSSYTLQDGVSVVRLAAFLAHVHDLMPLTLSRQVDAFPLLDSNAQLQQLFLDSPTCSEVAADLLVPVPHLQELALQCQLWALPEGFLDHTPDLAFSGFSVRGLLQIQPLSTCGATAVASADPRTSLGTPLLAQWILVRDAMPLPTSPTIRPPREIGGALRDKGWRVCPKRLVIDTLPKTLETAEIVSQNLSKSPPENRVPILTG